MIHRLLNVMPHLSIIHRLLNVARRPAYIQLSPPFHPPTKEEFQSPTSTQPPRAYRTTEID